MICVEVSEDTVERLAACFRPAGEDGAARAALLQFHESPTEDNHRKAVLALGRHTTARLAEVKRELR